MNKILRVAITEYLNAVRSKAFIIGIIMLPVLMFGGILVAKLAKDKVDLKDRRFAVLDHSERLYSVIETKLKDRNARDIFDWRNGTRGRQIRPAFIAEQVHFQMEESARADLVLSERVRKKELLGFLTIGKDAAAAEGGPEAEICYYTETPTFLELPDWLQRVINEEVQRLRFERANVNQELVRKLTKGATFRRLGLAHVSATGEVIKAKEENKIATFAIPAISLFLMFLLVMTSAPALLNTVLEEKLQKISEILIAAVSPFQLMMGKLMGAVMVSLTLSVLYLGTSIFFIWKSGLDNWVPSSIYFWFLLFQLLALMIYGSIFTAIGAACTEIKDAQNMMFPAMMLIMIPMFTWMPVLQSPSSLFARLISLFPPATPMMMLLRIAIPPGPPWWEIALGVVLTTAFMLACVWASAKIFRIGILSHGQTPSLGKLIKWVVSR